MEQAKAEPSIANSINKYLQTHNISIEQLASMCHRPVHALQPVILGYRAISSADYGLICKVLEVPLESFINLAEADGYKRPKAFDL